MTAAHTAGIIRNTALVSGNTFGYDLRMSNQTPTSEPPQAFPPTRWSLVVAATRKDALESAAALESLCRAYWYPLYAYVRRRGQSPQDAQDITQEFFCRLLEKRWLDSADRAKGRLRAFLVVALKNFMSKEWRRASAQRRGGGQHQVAFDTAFAESRFAADPAARLEPDAAFDREWALTLLDLTIHRLRAEFAAAGRPEDFEALKSCLLAERGAIDYSVLAGKIGSNEGAARVAAHRLRKRFRQIYRDEIAQTLAEGADLDDELRHLAAALSG
jgi:RNA polymerase sigma-70 factor (ECF subfamily)